MSTEAVVKVSYPAGHFSFRMTHDGYPDTVCEEIISKLKQQWETNGHLEDFLLELADPYASPEPTELRSSEFGNTFEVDVENGDWIVTVNDKEIGEVDKIEWDLY
jgi:hypothetical protein